MKWCALTTDDEVHFVCRVCGRRYTAPKPIAVNCVRLVCGVRTQHPIIEQVRHLAGSQWDDATILDAWDRLGVRCQQLEDWEYRLYARRIVDGLRQT